MTTLNKELSIYGEGGGGDAPDAPVEQDDTLESRQTLRVLFAVSEGEIANVNDVYINKVKSTNYKRVTVDTRLGTPSQDVIPGFQITASPHPDNTPLVLHYNSPAYKVVSSTTVDAMRITFYWESIIKQDDNGNIVGSSCEHLIYVRKDSVSTWSLIKTMTVSGKSSGVYARDIRINRPVGGTLWEIKIVRSSADPTTIKEKNLATWNSTIELIDAQLSYPKTALVAITAKNAIRFGGTLPPIMFNIRGVKVKVPAEVYYNVNDRTYTGATWNGAFASVKYWTDCPAWCLYDLLTDPDKGRGLPEAAINVFSFWEFAKWCDQQIPKLNEVGTVVGYERRFSLNNQFFVRENSRTVTDYILTLCNAQFSSDQFGNLTIVFDGPITPTKLESNATVIDGVFEYSSTDLEERYTHVNVTYSNAEDFGNTDTVVFPGDFATSWEQTFIDKYGEQVIDIPLVGCTSKYQALRKAKWTFYTSCLLTQLIGFRKFAGGIGYRIGEIVQILDDANVLLKQQGLIVNSVIQGAQRRLNLDRTVEFGNETYSVSYYTTSGLVEYVVEQTNVSEDFVLITSSAPAPIDNSLFVITGNIKYSLWKVVSIALDTETQYYSISAAQYDPNKYSYVDAGVYIPPPPFINFRALSTPSVTNISIVEHFYQDVLNSYVSLIVRWDWSDPEDDSYVPTYIVYWRKDNQNYRKIEGIQAQEMEISHSSPGIYDVIVYALNPRGIMSEGTAYSYNYKVGATSSTLLPPTNLIIRNTGAQSFQDKNADIIWSYDPDSDFVSDKLLDYIVEIWTSDGLTLKKTYVVQYNREGDREKGGDFLYTLAMNSADFNGPHRTFIVKVYSRDFSGNRSTPIAHTFTNPAPAAVSVNALLGIDAGYFFINAPNDPDIVGFLVWMSTTIGFTPSNDTLIYDGTSTNYSIPLPGVTTTYYVRAAAYDAFSKTDLNISSEYSAKALGLGVITWTFAGITFKPNDPSADWVSWTAGSTYSDQGASYSISAGSAQWTTGIMYIYYKEGETILRTTTVFGVAISDGTRVLATYQGGTNLIIGNGDAFISGDKLIAGTVGAEQLVADSAVITGSAQIANAIINTAHIDYIDADVITVNTLYADRIISGSLGHTVHWDALGTDIAFPANSITAVIDHLFYSQYLAGRYIEFNVGFGFCCPVDTTLVRMVIAQSDYTPLISFDFYNRDGQRLSGRFIAGTLDRNLYIPADRYLRILIYVRAYSTDDPAPTYNINDPYLDITERYA